MEVLTKITPPLKNLLKAPAAHAVQKQQLVGHILLIFGIFYFPFLTLLGVLWGWLISGLGGVLIGHRYAAHSQFEFPGPISKTFFYILYNLNSIGSAVNYANIHILHHTHSDNPELDPTSWKRTGLLATHFSFYGFDFRGKINIRQYKRLMRDRWHRFFHHYYYLPHLILFLLLVPFGFKYVVAFLVVPAVISFHIAQLQVGILHVNLPGSYQSFDAEESYNIPWLKPLLFGEELHNNHHKFPAKVNRQEQHDLKEIDPLYTFLIKPFFILR